MSTVSSHPDVYLEARMGQNTMTLLPSCLAASESTSASIEAENFIESDFCNLTSKAGGITAAGIKSDKISLASVSGDIECSGLVQASFPPLLHTICSFLAHMTVNLYQPESYFISG